MVTAVVMVGGNGGESEPVAWVQGARRAAARDLLEQLGRQRLVQQVVLVTSDGDGLAAAGVDHFYQSTPGRVHVGEQLARIVADLDVDRLLYLGGGAVPLLGDEALTEVVAQLATAEAMVLTNNQFASDWAGITPAGVLAEWVPRLPRDNMLGWVLSAEAGLPVQAQPATAASRLDIDTPLDLLTLRLHPRTHSHLRRYLETVPLDPGRVAAALAVLATPASKVFISGRVGPDVWAALNAVTRCWLRVVSEERGMVSSGRQARGEARSLVAAHLEAVGMASFFATLATWADAAFIDTRVLLAHHQIWPGAADRFASDLGRVDEIENPWLRAFTAAAQEAPIPIVLGGHGLMSGNMFAFAEMLGEGSPAGHGFRMTGKKA